MNCKMCGDGKTMAHAGPCVPVDKPTVRWGIRYIKSGEAMATLDGQRFEKRTEALYQAGLYSDSTNPRIVKLTRKAKPKVVERRTYEGCVVSGICVSSKGVRVGNPNAYAEWLMARVGKRVRIILEELSDE